MNDFRYVVTKEEDGLRLKQIVKAHFAFSSRLMTKLKQNNLIYLNGEQLPLWVECNENDVVTINLPKEESDFEPEDIPLDIAYEDEYLVVINKQKGLVTHPTKGKPYHTLANALSFKIQNEEVKYKIRFVNRLDMNTTGLLIVAKNSHVQDVLVKEMADNTIRKKYLALVDGLVKDDIGTIDKPIGRPDPNEVERWILDTTLGGFNSVTHYRVLKRFLDKEDNKNYSLVELTLDTGRTHQIRVHMASIGHPIVGDHLYCNGDPFLYREIHGDNRPPLTGIKGPRDTNPEIVSKLIDRQALHAYSLNFIHPITNEKVEIKTELPNDFLDAISRLEEI